MADQVVEVRVKTTVEGEEQIQDINKNLEETTKSSKEMGETVSMGDTAFGRMFNSIKAGAKMGVNSFKTLKGAIAATGIGLLIIAVGAVVQWFKKTETGSDLLAKGMKMLGQIIKEGPMAIFNAFKVIIDVFLLEVKTVISVFKGFGQVLTGKKSIKEAITDVKETFAEGAQKIKEDAGKIVEAGKRVKDAAKLAEAWDALDDKRRDNLSKNKQLEAEVAELREKASDTDLKLIDRINALNKAQKVANDLHQINKDDKEEELRLIEEELRLYPDNAEWIEKQAKAKEELATIELGYSNDKKKINKQLNTLEREQTKTIDDEIKLRTDAQAKYSKDVLDIQNRLDLLKLQGKEKELEALAQSYEKDKETYKDNLEVQALLDEEYLINKKLINDKYDEEAEKKRQDEIKKRQQELDNVLQQQKDFNDKLAEEQAETDEEKLELELERLEDWYEQEQEKYKENKEALAALDELYEGKIKDAKIKSAEETAKKQKEIAEDVADAAFSIGQELIGAIGDSKMESLNRDRERELSNENLTESQKAAINKKYAKKEAQVKKTQAIISAALAIIQAFAQLGPIAGAIAAVGIAVSTGIQINKINQEANRFGKGGRISGQSHSQGGQIIEAEGGEYVVNKRAMMIPQYRQTVERINQSGNSGVPVSTNSNFDYEELARAFSKVNINTILKQGRLDDSNNKTKILQSNTTLA